MLFYIIICRGLIYGSILSLSKDQARFFSNYECIVFVRIRSFLLNNIKEHNQNQREDRVNQEKLKSQASDEAGQETNHKKQKQSENRSSDYALVLNYIFGTDKQNYPHPDDEHP